ncbi:hypothetical protein R3P38DRAFT_2814570 [Favolaschia claudopus]|uniref:Uncharacterized protein n=1 Tax=Favolaschia claudopus TaxID=2862362 RepID=A0AAV9Z3A2_9AGAR
MCPEWYTNHGSVTANGLTGPVDVLYGLKRKSLELKRLDRATRADSDQANRTSQRYPNKYAASIEYGTLIGLQNQALETSGILTRFRDINLKWYRHCVNDASTKHADPSYAESSKFGKETEEHTIQQGSVRVNNGMQQDIGELAAHSCPLERKGNQAWNASYGNGELQLKFREKGPQTGGWEGIAVDVLNNRSQMSQVSGSTVADVIQPLKPQEFKESNQLL